MKGAGGQLLRAARSSSAGVSQCCERDSTSAAPIAPSLKRREMGLASGLALQNKRPRRPAPPAAAFVTRVHRVFEA